MNAVTSLEVLHADWYRTTSGQADFAGETVRRVTFAYQMTGIEGTKRPDTAQAIDGFEKAGFTRRICSGNEIEGG
jgi:hypothetical protein